MQIDVLGTTYTLRESNKVDDPALEQCDGYCDDTAKVCVIDECQSLDAFAKLDMDVYRRKLIRHELTHAFLSESGLCACSWAGNEEIVDWIANMFPKLAQAFSQGEQLVKGGE